MFNQFQASTESFDRKMSQKQGIQINDVETIRDQSTINSPTGVNNHISQTTLKPLSSMNKRHVGQGSHNEEIGITENRHLESDTNQNSELKQDSHLVSMTCAKVGINPIQNHNKRSSLNSQTNEDDASQQN